MKGYQIMYEIFMKLLQERNMTIYQFSKLSGIAATTIYSWAKKGSTINVETGKKIASFFNVSLDYLMGNEETKGYYLNDETRQIAQEVFENPDMRSLFDMSRKMTPERLKAHLEFMKKLYDEDNR